MGTALRTGLQIVKTSGNVRLGCYSISDAQVPSDTSRKGRKWVRQGKCAEAGFTGFGNSFNH